MPIELMSNIDYRSRDDVAICHHLIQNDLGKTVTSAIRVMDALSQVTGFHRKLMLPCCPDTPHE